MKFTLLTAFIALLALAAGFGLGRSISHSGPPAEAPNVRNEPIKRTPASASSLLSDKNNTARSASGLRSTIKGSGGEPFIEALLTIDDQAERLQLLLECTAEFSSAEFEELMSFFVANHSLVGKLLGDPQGIVLLIEPWMRHDPDAAIEFWLRQEGRMKRNAFYAVAMLSGKDYEAGMAKIREKAKELGDDPFARFLEEDIELNRVQLLEFVNIGKSTNEALRIVREEGLTVEFDSFFESGAEIDNGTVDELLRFEVTGKRQALVRHMFETWMRRDLASALEGLERYAKDPTVSDNEAHDLKADTALHAFGAWAQFDPDEALRLAGRFTGTKLYERMMDNIAASMAPSDPDRALSVLEASLGKEPADILDSVMDWKVPTEFRLRVFDRMLESGADLPEDLIYSGLGDPFGETLFERTFDDDPVATSEWLLENLETLPLGLLGLELDRSNLGNFPEISAMIESEDNPREKSPAQKLGVQMGLALAGSDFQAALGKMAELPPGGLRDGYVEGLASRGAIIDPEGTAAFLGNLSEAESAGSSLALAKAWLLNDSEAAMQFVGIAGEEVFDGAVRFWAKHDISSALTWLADNDQPAVTNYLSDPAMHTHWIEQDAFGGAAVVSALPPAQAQSAMAGYVSEWAGIAPNEASRFINESLEPGPVRDATIVSLAAAIAPDDAAAARKWVMAIHDPVKRAQALAALP